MINETPTKLDAPATKASTTPFSPKPLGPVAVKNIIIIANTKNDEAMVGNHQPCDITPQTIIGKVTTNNVKINFFRMEKLVLI